MTKRSTKATLSMVAAFGLAVSAILLSAVPASASTAGISGAQNFDTQVYWSYGRSNTHPYNAMTISPYNGTDCGYPTLLVGARYTAAAGASNGKTGTMSPGQSGVFYNANLGNYRMPMGTFYLTTYVGPSGGCPGFVPTWTATLTYNVAN